MDMLILHDVHLQKKPGTREELLAVSGFGPAKAAKYGEEILQLLGESKS